jgi:hypothetical protein
MTGASSAINASRALTWRKRKSERKIGRIERYRTCCGWRAAVKLRSGAFPVFEAARFSSELVGSFPAFTAASSVQHREWCGPGEVEGQTVRCVSRRGLKRMRLFARSGNDWTNGFAMDRRVLVEEPPQALRDRGPAATEIRQPAPGWLIFNVLPNLPEDRHEQ